MKWIAEVDLQCPQRGWKWALVCMGNCLRGRLAGAHFCQRRVTSELLMQSSGPAVTGNPGFSEWLRVCPFRRTMSIGEPVTLISACVNGSLFACLRCTSLGPSLVVLALKSVWDVGTGEFIHHRPNALTPCGKSTFGGILASACLLVSPLSLPPLFIYVWIAHRVECS